MLTATILFLVLILATGLTDFIPIHWRWLATILWFLGFLALIGKVVTQEQRDGKRSGGRWTGILIDNRFKISLSRLQIMLWTVLALSTFTVIALDRTIPLLRASYFTPSQRGEAESLPNPLDVRFPEELLLAMGISVTSLAGASWIKSKKTEKQSSKIMLLVSDQEKLLTEKLNRAKSALLQANNELARLAARKQELIAVPETDSRYAMAQLELERLTSEQEPAAKRAMESAEATLNTVQKEWDEFQKGLESRKGDVHVNDSLEQADWSDLLRGELVSNYRVVDPAKVQMFFLTVILVFIYGVMIWGLLSAEPTWQSAAVVDLPAFSDSMVALLGISHAGYLLVKQTGD